MDNRPICLKLWKDYKEGRLTLAEMQAELDKLMPLPKEVEDIAGIFGGRVERGCKEESF